MSFVEVERFTSLGVFIHRLEFRRPINTPLSSSSRREDIHWPNNLQVLHPLDVQHGGVDLDARPVLLLDVLKVLLVDVQVALLLQKIIPVRRRVAVDGAASPVLSQVLEQPFKLGTWPSTTFWYCSTVSTSS